MKLALVRARYTAFGGAERFVEGALRALADEGVTLTVIARQWSGDKQRTGLWERACPRCRRLQSRPSPLPHPSDHGSSPQDRISSPPVSLLRCDPFYLGRLWRDWSFARCVQRATAGGDFDLVQSHERIPGCDIFRAGDGAHAAWLEARARVLPGWRRLAQRLSPWHRYVLAQEARMLRHPRLKAVICNSAMVRDDMRRFHGLPEARLHVVHNGVDGERFSPALKAHRAEVRAGLAIAPEAPLFLLVGSGFERKGVGPALEALAAMTNRGAHLVVVGRDRHEARYRRLAARLGVAGRAHFAGPQPDPRPYYGAADAFILPTLYEPFSNAVLEALASGLPVITSARSGAAELITPGRNGFVCDALDVSALARHVDALSAPGAAAAMTEAAVAAVAGLTPAAMAQRLVGLYRGLTGWDRGG
ncbi:MAG: glycosyltransferase family 4 protein [Betaproteobacteria bacterium]|nr:glycosyltransferase family 4 protein [Betaproteobacteria bacterium]